MFLTGNQEYMHKLNGGKLTIEKLILYRGFFRDKPELNTEERFVYIGEGRPIEKVHQRTYILYKTLQNRIGKDCKTVYQNDKDAWKVIKNYDPEEMSERPPAPYPVWDRFGEQFTLTSQKDNKFYFAYLGKEEEILFLKYCEFAIKAQSIQKEPWTVMGRSWDSAAYGKYVVPVIFPGNGASQVTLETAVKKALLEVEARDKGIAFRNEFILKERLKKKAPFVPLGSEVHLSKEQFPNLERTISSSGNIL
ncbi:hypothetical protein CPB86DRAFT_502476 [Serendipita vermifera]|nr:hypothetical protein CPB86DRAFT_502476 [Serendipita vermifera]